MYDESLEVVVTQEPWRQRVGHPESVDDPLWEPSDADFCEGTIDWEGRGSKHWVCVDCGYIGWCTSTRHRKPLPPDQLLARSRRFYLDSKRKIDPKITHGQLEAQTDFVIAVALRVAATKSSSELRDFIEKLSRL